MIPGFFAAAAAGGGGPAPGGDQYWANVSSLLHFDGANASTTFTDETGKSWLAVNGAQLSTANSKFGGASLLLADGDRVSNAGSAAFAFGTGDFTIEGWFRPTKVTTGYGGAFFLDLGVNISGGLAISLDEEGRLEVRTTSGNRLTIQTNFSPAAFRFLSICRAGSTLYVGDNGSVTPYSFAIGTHTYSSTVTIGLAATFGYSGNIDDLRITKGVARYTGNFTPPTAPFPNGP